MTDAEIISYCADHGVNLRRLSTAAQPPWMLWTMVEPMITGEGATLVEAFARFIDAKAAREAVECT